MPKLFRRCAKTWVKDGHLRHLRESLLASEEDVFYPTDDDLAFGPAALRQHHRADEDHGVFEDVPGSKLRLIAMPWDLVFVEKESETVDARTGERMTS